LLNPCRLLSRFQPSDNPDVYKTLQLDVGNAYKEITEIKFEMGRPFDKVSRVCRFWVRNAPSPRPMPKANLTPPTPRHH